MDFKFNRETGFKNTSFKKKIATGSRTEIPWMTRLQKKQGDLSSYRPSTSAYVFVTQFKLTHETEGTDAVMGRERKERAQSVANLRGRRLRGD